MFALLVLELRDRSRREKTESPPQEEKLLRPPGYSLALKMEELWDEFTDRLFEICVGAAVTGMLTSYAFELLRGSARQTAGIVLLTCSLGIFSILVQRVIAARALLQHRRNCRLGLRGEQAVAEALTEVGPNGYRAFHDLPGGENWNIDHVVVGPQGVFVIETKARRRRAVAGSQPAHVVGYDGDTLTFPTGKDHDAIPQARRNAKWVADYLTKKTGERVDAAPLVVLPGWYVECTASDTKGFAAMNATYLKKYLASQPERVPPAQLRRIIALLEDKCRDLVFEP